MNITTAGVISGIPTTAGVSDVTLSAKDQTNRVGSSVVRWTVGTGVTVTNPGAQQGTINQSLSVPLGASGGTGSYQWSATGLTINTATGVLSGTPTTAGKSTVSVKATDTAGRNNTAVFDVTVAAAPTVTAPAAQTSTTGTEITAVSVAATGGTGAYAWSATGLPTGLTINATTGVISGAPTTSGSYTVAVAAKDTTGRTGTSSTFAWTVGTPVFVTNPGPQNHTTGSAVSVPLTAGGGTASYTWSATGLPTGLTINTTTGTISGTPTTAGTSSVTVKATDAAGRFSTVSIAWVISTPLTVTKPAAQIATTGTAITALALAAAGGATPYTWAVAGLPVGLSVTAAGAVSGTPTSTGTSTVTATVTDAAGRTATTTFTFNVAAPLVVTPTAAQHATIDAATTLQLAGTGGTTPYTWSATGLPTGLSLTSGTGVISGTPSTAGSTTVSATVTDTAGRTATITFAVTVTTAVTLGNPGAQNTTVGQGTTLALTATGGAAGYTFTATGLPAGLALDTTTGVISGTPTVAGSGTVSVTATDPGGRSATTTFVWATVLAAPGGVTATASGPQTLTLTWNPVAGATRYGVDRDGARIATTTGTQLADQQLKGATAYRYRVTAIGADNVESPPSGDTTATTTAIANAPVNYATCDDTATTGGCGYTASTPAAATYPDTTGSGLTDGIHGGTTVGDAWQGRRTTGGYSVTIDLGASRPITEINSGWLQARQQNIDLPAGLTYAASNDGHDFTDVAVITRPNTSTTDQSWTYRPPALTATARYVRMTVSGGTAWTLTDEVEVRGTVALTLPALTVATPVVPPVDQGQSIPPVQLSVTDNVGPLTWDADGLPPGLTINATTGVITGAAGTPGTYTVTVTATSSRGRTGHTSFLWIVYAGPASGPVMDSGTVAGFGPDTLSRGVSVLGGYAYTAVGAKVVRYDLDAGTNAAAQLVAGAAVGGCDDAGTGAQARFYNPQVLGTDGSVIYVLDTTCGLRAVNPGTGATRRILAPIDPGMTMVGHYLYTADGNGRLWRYDLQSGQTTRIFDSLTIYGALAADTTHLWAFNSNDAKLYQLDLTTNTVTKTISLPGSGFTAARVAGGYVYYADNRNLLTRVNKTTGALTVVAGDGAHNDDLLYNTTGIATDGTHLYTAGDHGLATLTTTPRVYEEPAPRAAVNFGDVRPLGPNLLSRGVTVLSGHAYTAVGTTLVRLDVNAGADAPAQPVAGAAGVGGCDDASRGAQARFYTPQVLGTDGSLIYVLDTTCGLRAVNPATGSTRRINTPVNSGSTIARNNLYTADNNGRLWRYDLQSGQTTHIFDSLTINGALAADTTRLWAFNSTDAKLYELDPSTNTVIRNIPLPAPGMTAALSAGDFVYYTDGRNLLTRVNKIDGTLTIVAGDGSHADDLLNNTTGIATDGTRLYTSGTYGIATLATVKRDFAEPATAPVMNSGKVTRFGPDRWAMGVTVLNGYAYTGTGSTIVRFAVTGGFAPNAPIPTEELIAGAASVPGCATANSGTRAHFSNPTVIGNDGSLVYVLDYTCGLRAVNPVTGSTFAINTPVYPGSAIARNNLYTADSSGRIWRYDLRSGQTNRIFDSVSVTGALAADNNYLWGLNNNDNKLYQLDLNTNTVTKTYPLPSIAASAALSVGDYVYYTDNRNLLTRISKNDGAQQIIAGDGAHNDDLISYTTAIATDGTRLYTAGDHGLYAISRAFREFAAPITDGEGPQLGLDSSERKITNLPGNLSGVTVLGWYAYTASGSKVSKTDIQTGETTPVAGGNLGCHDADAGFQATFYNASSVVGSDGSLIYVLDSTCGLRAVNPATGSTRTLHVTANQRSSIAGEYLYTIDPSNTLYQYGLKSGVTNKVIQNLPPGALMAAFESGVFIVDDRTKKTVLIEDTHGKKVESWIGHVSQEINDLPWRAMGSYMAYADGALYLMSNMWQSESGLGRLTRIDAIGGMTAIGESLNLSSGTNAGLAVTKTDVYRLTDAPDGRTELVRTHTGGVQDEDPTFQVNLGLYIEEGTFFLPTSHAQEQDLFPSLTLLWDSETGLCAAACQGVKTLAREYYERSGDKEEPWLCGLGIEDCTVDDYERFIIFKFVDKQEWYDHDGDLLRDRKKNFFIAHCLDLANNRDDCEIDNWLTLLLEYADTIYDVVELVRDLLRGRGGLRESCRNSFRGDTPVLMADGSTIAIQDIRPGHQVLAGDPVNQTTAAEPVTAVHAHTDTELTDLTLANGSVVHTTAYHPFWTPDLHKWTDAKDLTTGTHLSSPEGTLAAVQSMRNFTNSMTMYNLTVDQLHTYYVLVGTVPVLVHNSNCWEESEEVLDEIYEAYGPRVSQGVDWNMGRYNEGAVDHALNNIGLDARATARYLAQPRTWTHFDTTENHWVTWDKDNEILLVRTAQDVHAYNFTAKQWEDGIEVERYVAPPTGGTPAPAWP